VLEEGTEESSIEIAHATDRRDAHACRAPTGLRGSDQFEPGTAREQRTGAAKPTEDAAAINRQDAVPVNAFGIICSRRHCSGPSRLTRLSRYHAGS